MPILIPWLSGGGFCSASKAPYLGAFDSAFSSLLWIAIAVSVDNHWLCERCYLQSGHKVNSALYLGRQVTHEIAAQQAEKSSYVSPVHVTQWSSFALSAPLMCAIRSF